LKRIKADTAFLVLSNTIPKIRLNFEGKTRTKFQKEQTNNITLIIVDKTLSKMMREQDILLLVQKNISVLILPQLTNGYEMRQSHSNPFG
jgi:hypothetical protein